METIEEVQRITRKYVKQWIYDDSNSNYLSAHTFGLHVAQYKDAIDCGLQEYIKEKIKCLKNSDIKVFMKQLDNYPRQEQIDKDINFVQTWIDRLTLNYKN